MPGFHDCVGGCDGCINLDNDDNAGLEGERNFFSFIFPQYIPEARS
jgi:hypothetical protein